MKTPLLVLSETHRRSVRRGSCPAFLALLALAPLASGELVSQTSSMRDYQTGDERLTVYTDVPGHEVSMMNGGPTRSEPYPSRARSDIYEIRVRSAATDHQWVRCFANMTYNRASEVSQLPEFETSTAMHAYQKHTSGWTHTYANIEMSENSPVEVEITKIGGTLLDGSVSIVKSAVHPAHKIIDGSKRDENGRVYFKIDRPCQIVIDINGQMDDHNAAYSEQTPGGRMPNRQDGSRTPVHSIAFYANPIIVKPDTTLPRVPIVFPAGSSRTDRLIPPDPATYDTLVFAPGVHNIGPGFKVYPGKHYYIPGDAILYGSITNEGTDKGAFRSNGDRIKIYGYGSICGVQIPHYQRNGDTYPPGGGSGFGLPHNPNPEYPEWNAWPQETQEQWDSKRKDKGIRIQNTLDVRITGVSVIDPANFNTSIDGNNSGSSLVNWVKLHSWRVNGDGFGGYTQVEDSFIRACDDSTYVRNWRRRCTFWKDTNANIFRFINYISGGLEDCDILYSRWRDPGGVGNLFEFVNFNGSANPLVMKIKDVRFHDKLSNPSNLINLGSGTTFIGLTFENVSFFEPMNGALSTILGSEAAPYAGALMFKNVTFQDRLDGSAPVRINQGNYQRYFTTNSFVDPSIFEPAFTLTTSAANGRIVLSPPGGSYLPGTVVTVAAYPDLGYSIGNWGGDLGGAAGSTTITMDGNKSITASFASAASSTAFAQPATATWTVPVGVYSATFHLWGAGGAGGSAHHGSTSTTSLTALGGGGAGGSYASKTLQVTPGQQIQYTIGAGGIGATLGVGESFPSGSYGAEGGSSFASLQGGEPLVFARGGGGGNNVSSSGGSATGTERGAVATGNIGDVNYYGGRGAGTSFTTSGAGGGGAGSRGSGGDASTNGPPGLAGLGGGGIGGANRNSTGNGSYGGLPGGGGAGAALRNSTTPEAIRTGGNGGDGQMIVTYNTMTFTLVTNAVNGNVTLDAPGGAYTSGATAIVSATPSPGYAFAGWSGDLGGAANSANLLMNGNKTITAIFAEKPFVLAIREASPGGNFELSIDDLEPTWSYELQESTDLSSPWVTVSGSLKTNVTEAVWSIVPQPGELRKFFRVIRSN